MCFPGIRSGERHGGTRHSAVLQTGHDHHYHHSTLFRNASIAQDHVERDAAAAPYRRHAEHRVYGAGMSVSLSSVTAFDLTRHGMMA